MSQNPNHPDPYSQFGQPVGGGAYSGDFIDPTPTRTSVTAIIALVVSIVGCIACIIPGPGAIATVIGGLAVFFIARSSGRLRGMGLAVTSIVLGLLQSIAWISLWTGLSQVNATAGKQFFVPVGQMMSAIESGDTKGARALFSKDANAAITDEMLKDFADRYHKSAGAFQKMPENVWETVTMAMELGKSAGASKKQSGRHGPIIQPRGGPEPQIPIPARFALGSAFVMVTMDPNAPHQSQGMPPLANVEIVTLDGKEIWLIDPIVAQKQMNTAPAVPSTDPKPPVPDGDKPSPDKP